MKKVIIRLIFILPFMAIDTITLPFTLLYALLTRRWMDCLMQQMFDDE